jgi:hypothetical protein
MFFDGHRDARTVSASKRTGWSLCVRPLGCGQTLLLSAQTKMDTKRPFALGCGDALRAYYFQATFSMPTTAVKTVVSALP